MRDLFESQRRYNFPSFLRHEGILTVIEISNTPTQNTTVYCSGCALFKVRNDRELYFRSRRRAEAAPSMTSWILTSEPQQPRWSALTRLRGQRPVSIPGAQWAGRGEGQGVHRGAVVRTPGGAWGPSSPALPSLTPGEVSGVWVCRPPGAHPWCLLAPPLRHPQESSKEVTLGGQGAPLLLQGPIMAATMILGELPLILRLHPPKVTHT